MDENVDDEREHEGSSEANAHFVAKEEEIGDGDRVIVDVNGREISIFNIKGEYYALLNYCVHQGGPLCEGFIRGDLVEEEGRLHYGRQGEIITCPWHGWEFDIKTGIHLARPNKYKIPTYDVKAEDGNIYVDIG